jgi:hypothetical protein
METLLAGQGFLEAKCEPLTGGIVSLYTAQKAVDEAPTAAP